MAKPNQHKQQLLLIIALLCVAVTIAYYPVFDSTFINFDDPGYVSQNAHVQKGISIETIKWAFTTIAEANWHPLTWLSFAFDFSVAGLNPAYFHASSLFIHLLSSILLFLVLERMTQQQWQSAFVAVVFALHPMHVESVAWISERKDVLAALFWMLTMGAYVLYCRSSNVRYYYLALVLFALGLLAKPMLVTLPFVLLLLDYWPLNRVSIFDAQAAREKKHKGISLKQSLREKIPFFTLTLASSIVTYVVQQRGKTMEFAQALTFQERIANAIVSYLSYLRITLLPVDLAIFYPYRENTFSVVQIGIAVVVLALISVIVWRQKKERPYLLVGWLWFLGTLVPVIGIVQVGMQGLADRYMYLPMIGLSVMVAWGFSSALPSGKQYLTMLSGAFVVLTLLMVVGTQIQASRWKSSRTLFEHTIHVTSDNYLAHHCLGADLADSGKTTEAIAHFREVLRLKPEYAPTHNNLGVALATLGKFDEAETHWKRATELAPEFADAFSNLARLYALQGKPDEAIRVFNNALQLDPNHLQAHFNYGNLLAKIGKIEEARMHYTEALRVAPGFQPARKALQNLGSR
ncbi:MAG: tetratricopeptide repeat protein [Bacteroidetes bacterium]|nr:MAG: tetratricopeptide repeat protein [Bacteroidota bacterium]